VDNLVSKRKKVDPQTEKTVEAPIKGVESEPAFCASLSVASGKLAMTDILASLTDPSLQSFRKSLSAQQTSKSKSVGQTLSAPLARPIQEKLERKAAYQETKTEISKWQATVKANREVTLLPVYI
jgi:U3 small nucleolar RNA-associated protein 14